MMRSPVFALARSAWISAFLMEGNPRLRAQRLKWAGFFHSSAVMARNYNSRVKRKMSFCGGHQQPGRHRPGKS